MTEIKLRFLVYTICMLCFLIGGFVVNGLNAELGIAYWGLGILIQGIAVKSSSHDI